MGDFETTLSTSTRPSQQYEALAEISYGFSESEVDENEKTTTTETNSVENVADQIAEGVVSSAKTRQKRQSGLTGNSQIANSGPKMSDNLLRVSVYFNTLNERIITTSKVYDLSNFLSSLGGVFSLYLGISLGMLFELFEVLLDAIQNLCFWIVGKPFGRKHPVF